MRQAFCNTPVGAAATFGLAACVALAGCQTTPSSSASAAAATVSKDVAALTGGGSGITASAPSRATRAGFLTDYARLAPVPDGEGVRCWKAAGVDWKRFDSVLITRMQVSLKPGQIAHVDPSDLKALLDYFHGALVSSLKPQLRIVDKPGPGVLVLRVALTDLTPTSVVESLAGTAIPYGYAGEVALGAASGLPAGATPYLGETGIEAQFRDGASNAVIGECEDTEVGRKYAADLNSGASGAAQSWIGGYLNSFTTWSYAKDAFDKWAALLARRLAALRA